MSPDKPCPHCGVLEKDGYGHTEIYSAEDLDLLIGYRCCSCDKTWKFDKSPTKPQEGV